MLWSLLNIYSSGSIFHNTSMVYVLISLPDWVYFYSLKASSQHVVNSPYLISHHKTPTKIQKSVSTVHRPCISKQGVSVVKDLGHETSSSLTYAKTAILAVPGKKEGFPVENIPSKCFRLEAQENYSGHDYIKMISLGPVICRCDVESLVCWFGLVSWVGCRMTCEDRSWCLLSECEELVCKMDL